MGLLSHNDLLGCFSFLLFGLTAAHLVLIAANQRDVMIHEKVGDHLTLGGPDDNLFLLLLQVFLLLLWLVLLCVHIVLHKISNNTGKISKSQKVCLQLPSLILRHLRQRRFLF